MGFFDIFRNRSDPVSKREKMRKIRESGKSGEEQFRRDNFLNDIERKHHGRDFDEKTRDSRGRTRRIPWEVKRNNSPLSKKQKKTRNLHVRRYVDTPYGVESRTEDKHGNRLEHNMFTGKWEKVKKQKSSGFSFFGSNQTSKKRKSKSSDSLWGSNSSDSIWGTGTKRKSKRNSDSFW